DVHVTGVQTCALPIFLSKHKNPANKVEIALVGKYTSLQDSYKSISEAFTHAGAAFDTGVKIRWVYSGDLSEENIGDKLKGVDGKIGRASCRERVWITV